MKQDVVRMRAALEEQIIGCIRMLYAIGYSQQDVQHMLNLVMNNNVGKDVRK